MKHLILVLVIFASVSTYSQEKEKNNFGITFRGKIFGFFAIEDAYFSTGTAGLALVYKDKHIIGLDYSFFNWQYENDVDFIDSAGNWKHDYPVYWQFTRRSYLYLDYKYIHTDPQEDKMFYFNSYMKYGTYKEWYNDFFVEELYTGPVSLFETKTNGIFYEFGLGVGIKIYLNDVIGFDINVNGGKRFSENTLTNDLTPEINNTYKENKYLVYSRINFFIYAGR